MFFSTPLQRFKKILFFERLSERQEEEGDDRGRDEWIASLTQWTRVFEQAPGDGEGQGGLVCYSPWGHKEPDTTEQLNNICLLGWYKC